MKALAAEEDAIEEVLNRWVSCDELTLASYAELYGRQAITAREFLEIATGYQWGRNFRAMQRLEASQQERALKILANSDLATRERLADLNEESDIVTILY